MNGLAEFKRPVAVSKRQENAEEGWPMMGSAQAGMAWHGMAFAPDCSSAYFSATGSLLHSELTKVTGLKSPRRRSKHAHAHAHAHQFTCSRSACARDPFATIVLYLQPAHEIRCNLGALLVGRFFVL